MNRRQFALGTIAASALAAVPFEAFAASFVLGGTTTQRSLVDTLPQPAHGQWARFILGSGVEYQKQIGAATEATEHGDLLYYETQVGTPGGSCNPNTMKRTYLQGKKFTSLFDQAPVAAAVANSGTTLTRWGDLQGGQTQASRDATLQLLDSPYLYDDRPVRLVSMKKETLHLPASSAYSGSADSSRGPLHPFELRVYSFGTRFKTDLAMSLETIRNVTPDGTYIQTS